MVPPNRAGLQIEGLSWASVVFGCTNTNHFPEPASLSFEGKGPLAHLFKIGRIDSGERRLRRGSLEYLTSMFPIPMHFVECSGPSRDLKKLNREMQEHSENIENLLFLGHKRNSTYVARKETYSGASGRHISNSRLLCFFFYITPVHSPKWQPT